MVKLADVRTIPRSRHNPQYEQSELQKTLPGVDINYRHFKSLGGLRPSVKNSTSTAWCNKSFRNYADYMQTAEFKQGIEELLEYAAGDSLAIMRAEAVPWRCHRSLIADVLTARGVKVKEIISQSNPQIHKLTSFAVVSDNQVTYPETS